MLYKVNVNFTMSILDSYGNKRSSVEAVGGFVVADNINEAQKKVNRYYEEQITDKVEIKIDSMKTNVADDSCTGFFVNFCLV